MLLRPLSKTYSFYCYGSCGNFYCKRMDTCETKWLLLSAGACDLHKGHANGNQHEIRLRDIRTWKLDVECICSPAENVKQRQRTSCPLNLFARQVRDKIKKERPLVPAKVPITVIANGACRF